MTQRKPESMSFENWIDTQMSHALRNGELKDLPGKGQKIQGLEGPHDENWWIKNKLRDEKLNGAPKTLETRKKAEQFMETFLQLPSVWTLRKKASRLNEEIQATNRGDLGPLLPQKLLDIDDLSHQWRAHREANG